MKNASTLLAVLIAVVLLIALGGCSKKDDRSQDTAVAETDSSHRIASAETSPPPDNNDTAPAVADNTSLRAVVAAWDAGRKDEATRLFLSIDWQEASALEGMPRLTISEKQYLALAVDEQQRQGQETMTLLGSIRKLLFHIASEAERLAGAGNRTEAEQYLGAVRRYGNTLSAGDYIELVRMHGKAATEYAERKLSELK